MNPTSLRLVLVSLVVLLQLISLTVVSFLTKEQLGNQAQLEATSNLKAQADEVVEKTRLFLVPALSQLTTAGQLFADGMLDSRKDEQLSTFFRSQLRSNPWLKGMYLVREDGSMLRVGRFRDDRQTNSWLDQDFLISKRIRVDGDSRQIEYEELNELTNEIRSWQNPADNSDDPRQLHWYQTARAQQRLVWSDAFSYYDNGQPVISASLPIRTPKGLDAGVLSVAVDLHELTQFIERTSGRDINSAVMIDANGRVIAYSSTMKNAPHQAMSDIESMFRPSDEALLELYARANATGISSDGTDTMIEHLDMGEIAQMGLARTVYLFGGAIRWTLLITQPHWTKLATSDNILSSGMRLATIIIAAPGIMALLLIIAITAPIYGLHRRATIDQLTRAFNRDEFENRLRNRIGDLHSLPKDQQLVTVVLDLDGFKSINDHYGHPAGDLILRAVVKRLQKHAPSDTVVGRLGGDEFALLCSLDKQQDPLALIEKVRHQVTNTPVPSGNGIHTFGMTMGLTVIKPGDTAEAVLKRADFALVNGKLTEKNRTYDTVADTGKPPTPAARHTESEHYATA